MERISMSNFLLVSGWRRGIGVGVDSPFFLSWTGKIAVETVVVCLVFVLTNGCI